MTIRIPIHSFVDLITNSSSEIFVSADESTVKAVKKLIDNILKASGSDKTVDDLFEIGIGYEVTDTKTYDNKFVTKAEFEKIEAEYQEWEDGELLAEPRFQPCYSDGDYRNSNLIVTVKDDVASEQKLAARNAAKTLSDLTGLFEIDASYG